MRLVRKLFALTILLYGAAAYAYRPLVEAPRDVVIEGYIEAISFATGTTPSTTGALMVNSVKVYITTETVIKTETGYLRPENLKVGTKVAIYGHTAKGRRVGSYHLSFWQVNFFAPFDTSRATYPKLGQSSINHPNVLKIVPSRRRANVVSQ